MHPLKLEIGSGLKPREGYTNCDIRDLPHVDIVCNANQLPFGDESVDEIYSRHLIEHFTFKEFLIVLEEWNRVLKTDGVLYLICPNLIWHLQQIIDGSHNSFFNRNPGENARFWGFGSLFGWQDNEFDIHKFGYYFALLKHLLEELGFGNVEDLTDSGKGIENKPWHLEVRAKKARHVVLDREGELFNHFNAKH
ncbi:MAG: hypothetical protein RL660_1744 [Bacteroidota bacterium]|jgi:predicted SAM-dependent methyltransferase